MNEETLKAELTEILEDHICNLENIDLIAAESFRNLYEVLVEGLQKLIEEDENPELMEGNICNGD